MDSSRVFSLRPGGFPEGLRVLLVDDDSTSLTLVEKMLKKCKYEVTCTSSAEEAVKILGERKDWFEIVMCDVKEDDVFIFVEHVHKLNIPVIMMTCGDGDTSSSRVVRGLVHGAACYLVKPLRLKELKLIWQHVFRKKLINGQQSLDEILNNDQFSQQSGNRRIRSRSRDEIESESKKPRLSWTPELDEKFIQVVNRIGLDKAGPKKILDMMGDTSLTRENIASHLQKYRLKRREADITKSVNQQQNIVFPQQNIGINTNIQPQLPHHQLFPYAYTHHPPHHPPPPAVHHMMTNMDQPLYNPPIPSSNDLLNNNNNNNNDSYFSLGDALLLHHLMSNPTPPKLADLESFPYTTNQQQQQEYPHIQHLHPISTHDSDN